MNESKKQEEIEKIMQAWEGVNRAEPPSDLFDKIMNETRSPLVSMPMRQWRWLAASIMVLIVLNASLISWSLRSSRSVQNDPSDLSAAMAENYGWNQVSLYE